MTGERRRGGKASPIKDPFDVTLIHRTMVRRGYFKWAEVFLVGCNCALRASDLFALPPSSVVPFEQDGMKLGRVRDFDLKERKTQKRKEMIINEAGMEAFERLCNGWPDDLYLAQSEGNRANRAKPVGVDYFNRVLRRIREELDLPYRLSSHSMRKTFGYHAFKNAPENQKMETLLTLQKLYRHATPYETLEYIGITDERVEDLYISNVIGIGLGN